ncbi:MAG TPA: DinB family protein [Thermoanaerobaculia bacterium]|nr:DinB family protein [Thermoanaerobaculia bacterium]
MDPVKAWTSIPRQIRRAVSGLSARELGWRGGSENWTIREYAHHLVEANIVASSIIVAALGSPGARYDWSWLYPDERWMKRLGYNRAPLKPAIGLLDALCAHVAGILRRAPGGMSRHARLISTPRRGQRRTVRQILADESDHARHHLRDIAKAKSANRRR